ncbi:MAG: inorganic phosphate transporter [Planctomycetaceae bacterium]|jgi:inorganic phosphate transporter, PiT family|nr:inorganic phosphate transporter [Planctomycetaceae bacterium]MBT6484805.1 inorganic phosphate transporter [Planctomycetaceae bacterium]MBT6497976.1 inorganic phosphate transporter [Planctomycetaceae bacterium]
MYVFAILLTGLLLAYANGANDNFKGVATLFGSGTTDRKRALLWATLTTLLGSLCAIWLAGELLQRFSGKGIIPNELTANPVFATAIAVGAGLTVLLATRLGMPVSTTHALVGALTGAALASTAPIAWPTLLVKFFVPLLLSPVVAVGATILLYPAFRWFRAALGLSKASCFCAGVETVEVVPLLTPVLAAARAETLSVSLGTPVSCEDRYEGRLLGVNCAKALDGGHYLTAGLMSFARGLNDTPKIAALFLVAPGISPFAALALCGGAIAAGGLFNSRRVAETMSHRITKMNAGQGFTANLVTAITVIFASGWGLPVSTTHVSCGSLFGLGTITGQAEWRGIAKILLAWVITLPVAATIAGLSFRLLQS